MINCSGKRNTKQTEARATNRGWGRPGASLPPGERRVLAPLPTQLREHAAPVPGQELWGDGQV